MSKKNNRLKESHNMYEKPQIESFVFDLEKDPANTRDYAVWDRGGAWSRGPSWYQSP